ncbi:hypothetical protein [Brachybacterium sp. YJGR34]|uniref:hypothetical protein n=1 Tax=Brachybacterium sp. YJGR34 TaxID=2059911 RepID=UPI001E2A67EA|nr:hypothetical protein [Brachybacterium sp. YJGR34]
MRPLLLLLGGAVLTVVLLLVEQRIGAIALALFTVFMAYWTSPLRSGPHTSLAEARERAGGADAIVLWAPGDPVSARLQTAFRSPREDLIWVNVYRDPSAGELLEAHGGTAALPLVVLGEDATTVASAGALMDLQEQARRRADDEGA